jgi:hypothetical protein
LSDFAGSDAVKITLEERREGREIRSLKLNRPVTHQGSDIISAVREATDRVDAEPIDEHERLVGGTTDLSEPLLNDRASSVIRVVNHGHLLEFERSIPHPRRK